LRILNNAAQYIQATYKMVVLTSLFKELRRSAIIIQRNVRLWLSRRNAISERLKEYLETEYLALHKRRVSEQFTLLGNLYKEYPKKFGKMIMIFVENYRFQ
jgi:IQ calmodulin-binding motif.